MMVKIIAWYDLGLDSAHVYHTNNEVLFWNLFSSGIFRNAKFHTPKCKSKAGLHAIGVHGTHFAHYSTLKREEEDRKDINFVTNASSSL